MHICNIRHVGCRIEIRAIRTARRHGHCVPAFCAWREYKTVKKDVLAYSYYRKSYAGYDQGWERIIPYISYIGILRMILKYDTTSLSHLCIIRHVTSFFNLMILFRCFGLAKQIYILLRHQQFEIRQYVIILKIN